MNLQVGKGGLPPLRLGTLMNDYQSKSGGKPPFPTEHYPVELSLLRTLIFEIA